MKRQISNIAVAKITPLLKHTILILMVLLAIAQISFGQCKTFKLSDKGDTLNCIDYKGLKQGKWILKEPALRGNAGFDEEGEFYNDKKEGTWRRFSEQGDIEAVENYRWGLLDGKSQYYSLQGMEREESWRAIDPEKLYDTIEVPDLYNDAIVRTVIVKNDGQSMKHGKWIWYDPSTGFELKKEDYFRDSAVNSLAMFGVNKNDKRNPSDTSHTAKKVDKPAVVQEWEKKNSGKKKVTVRDGSAGY
jgi:hypothetical protein